MTDDTPRTDSCPHCGAKQIPLITVDEYECETFISKGGGNTKRSELCRERERHQDALLRYSEELTASKAEVERLRAALQSCYWATNTYDGNYTRACDNVAKIAINALKTQDK